VVLNTDSDPIEDVEGHAAKDYLGQIRQEKEEVCEIEEELRDLKRMLEESKNSMLLYPDCKHRHKKLTTILQLLQWKTSNGLSKKEN